MKQTLESAPKVIIAPVVGKNNAKKGRIKTEKAKICVSIAPLVIIAMKRDSKIMSIIRAQLENSVAEKRQVLKTAQLVNTEQLWERDRQTNANSVNLEKYALDQISYKSVQLVTIASLERRTLLSQSLTIRLFL